MTGDDRGWAQPIGLSGTPALPKPGIVLLWASWCGPCRAELSRVPALGRVARPLPLAILALDSPAAARAALKRVRGAAIFADARAPAEVLREWGGRDAGLPLAVALDRDGRVCGRKRGLLGTDQVRAWAKQCSR